MEANNQVGSVSGNSSSKLVLYSYWQSSCSWRVRFALSLKGLPYEYKAVNLAKGEQFSPEFERLNPLHFVPVLVDGDVVVSDSYAILLYLEEKYPYKGLLPTDPQRRALNHQAASIVSSSIQPLHMVSLLVSFCAISAFIISSWMQCRFGFRACLSILSSLFHQKRIKEISGGEECLSWAQSTIEKGFLALDKLLKNFAGRYATGEEVCMADVFLAPQIAVAVTRFNVDMSKYPTLSRIYESYKALPEFVASSPGRQPDFDVAH